MTKKTSVLHVDDDPDCLESVARALEHTEEAIDDAVYMLDERGRFEFVNEAFLEHPEGMVATGGTVRVANGCEIDHGQITRVGTSEGFLIGVQEMEYLRAFYSGRLGFSRLRGLILISGAFGLLRTDLVRETGGYDTESVTEDFDLVVRLHRHLARPTDPTASSSSPGRSSGHRSPPTGKRWAASADAGIVA